MADSPYRIELVCLGNICRSPMAHVVLDEKLRKAGLDGQVEISSSGTGGWHTGDPMDSRAAKTLSEHGYDPSRHSARKFTIDAFAENDLLLAMDRANLSDMTRHSPTQADTQKARMFRSFDPWAEYGDDEVPDPWYGGPAGFENVLATIERTTDALIGELPRQR